MKLAVKAVAYLDLVKQNNSIVLLYVVKCLHMKKIEGQSFVGERSLFSSKDLFIENVTFKDGESPLKESENISLNNVTFEWKYPLWYCKYIKVTNSLLKETARSGIWYIDNIYIKDSVIDAPKTFRRGRGISLNNVKMNNALETLWKCEDIIIKDSYAKGDYFGFNSSNIEIDNLTLDGNYGFDGGSNIVIRNSILNSKDAIWNCKNVTIYDSKIVGEYFGWSSENVTLINCEIISHQGFCYMKNLKMVNCKVIDSDLCFEYCEDLDVEVTTVVGSIKNPYSGLIKVKGVKELILDETYIDKNKTKIIIG